MTTPTDVIHGQVLLTEGQSSAHITANHLYTVAAGLAGLEVADITTAQPGADPADGTFYIIPDTGTITGTEWTSSGTPNGPAANNDVMYFNQGWYVLNPRGGTIAYVEDEDIRYTYDPALAKWIKVMPDTYTTTESELPYPWTASDEVGYQKVVTIGALPNNTTGSTAHGASPDTAHPIDCHLMWDNGTLFRVGNWTDGTDRLDFEVTSTNIVITTNFDASSFSGHAILRYAK